MVWVLLKRLKFSPRRSLSLLFGELNLLQNQFTRLSLAAAGFNQGPRLATSLRYIEVSEWALTSRFSASRGCKLSLAGLFYPCLGLITPPIFQECSRKGPYSAELLPNRDVKDPGLPKQA